ncbi:MAG: DUF2851 family protein [Ignavibacteriaceae bacterium]
MLKDNPIREKLLYEIWKGKNFQIPVKTPSGQEIEIIDVGENNKDSAGPDFLNSRIKIGNITYQGDVEIDFRHSDWKSHGHYLDKRFNKVVLHIIFSNEKFQPYVITQNGRKVDTVSLANVIDDDYKSMIQQAIISERNHRDFTMPCSSINGEVPQNDKMKFITHLGIERFQKKEKRIFDRLIEMVYLKEMNIREPVVHYDFGENFQNKKFSTEDFNSPLVWQQLIYEMIFEALGYSQNKDIMLRLAKALNLEFFSKLSEKENIDRIIESAMFNVSDLIPKDYSTPDEESAEYIRSLIETWSEIKESYDGIYFNKQKWHFFRLRPFNFPTIRIAGGSVLLKKILMDDLFGKIVEMFSKDEGPGKIISYLRNIMIVKAHGFWSSHYVFEKKAKERLKYFIGLSRADDIIVNVILPVFSVYFEIFRMKEETKRVKKLSLNYIQNDSNKIVDQVVQSLNLNRGTVKSIDMQGMIELFRYYCVKERCKECEIGKVVFK